MTDLGADEPLIHQPSEKDDHVRNGLVCFLDPVRECGSDCMAYSTMPETAPNLGEQQRHCTLLVSVDRLGRHTGILAKLMSDALRQRSGPQPPDPMGKVR